MNIIRLITLFFLFSFHLFSQREYFVKDGLTLEDVPFVKVFPNIGDPFLCDINGRFVLTDTNVTFVRLVYPAYKDTTYNLSSVNEKTLLIHLRTKEIPEITVMPGENPADRIMKQVIANRKKNNPLSGDSFRYKSYSKVVADFDSMGHSQKGSDSLLINEINRLFGGGHLFFIESSSVRTFVPPGRDQEKIIAYKTSGIDAPLLATFAKSLQSFSFYENQFNIGGKIFINPIALGGIKRYLFILEDTTFSGRDTVFHIHFRPRKNKNFNGMKGTLYINTNGYAVEKVIASPFQDSSDVFQITIIQEYTFLENKKWFPNKLSSEFSIVASPTSNVTGKSSTYIEDVELDLGKVKRNFLNNANLMIEEGANQTTQNGWDTLRKYQLTEKEMATYKNWDTLVEESNLDKKLYVTKALLSGKISMKYVSADLNRIINFNHYEGVRLGAGVETSPLLIEPITLGGYFAYGFRDQKWKYGGYLDIHIVPQKQFDLSLIYQEDVIERGAIGQDRLPSSLYSPSSFRYYYTSQMDSERLAKANLSAYITQNFKMNVFGSYNRIGFNSGYRYETNDLQNKPTSMDIAFVGAEINWRIREKTMVIDNNYIPISPTRFPVIHLKFEQALPNIYLSTSRFSRIYAEIKQNITVRGMGQFSYCISTGKTFGETPLTYAQTMLSSSLSNLSSKKMNLLISVPNTFETMPSARYYLKDQVSLFTRFNFNKWKSLSKKFQPQISLHHAVGFGSKVSPNFHYYKDPLSGLEKGYYEAGLLINTILSLNVYSIGLGGFYHYGYYSQPQARKNIFLKLTFGVAL